MDAKPSLRQQAPEKHFNKMGILNYEIALIYESNR